LLEIVEINPHCGYNETMETRELRVRIPKKLMIDYRKMCEEFELSVPAQTQQLIENFLQAQKDNLKIKKLMRGMGK
jgi:hypothetical protein